jgi:hypothetical protein
MLCSVGDASTPLFVDVGQSSLLAVEGPWACGVKMLYDLTSQHLSVATVRHQHNHQILTMSRILVL